MFVLLENEPKCEPTTTAKETQKQAQTEDACSIAPKVNAPLFNSPCYNGGSCNSTNNNNNNRQQLASLNYSCTCPTGFAGPLCEINIDDCVEHQCQNGAMCLDDVNSYKCVCRDPTTSGEFCEQLSQANSYQTSSANSIAPIALPIVSLSSNSIQAATPTQTSLFQVAQNTNNYENTYASQQSTLTARSADFYQPTFGNHKQQTTPASECKRSTQRKYYDDGNGCQSIRMLKISECSGTCNGAGEGQSASSGCCLPAKVKRRRIRMQCSDGASYVKTIDLVKKCACSTECSKTSNGNNNNKFSDSNQNQNQQQQSSLNGLFNATQEDQLLQITRLDAVD